VGLGDRQLELIQLLVVDCQLWIHRGIQVKSRKNYHGNSQVKESRQTPYLKVSIKIERHMQDWQHQVENKNINKKLNSFSER
jgi:hypothetical protein